MNLGIKLGVLFKETKGLMRYLVRFLANGGTGTMTDLKCNVGKEYSLPPNAFTRTGYHFKEWSAACQDGEKTLSDKASFKNLAKKNGFIVLLTAVWQGITYYIKYHKNDGSTSDIPLRSAHTYGSDGKLITNTFERTGYEYLGWSKSSSSKTAEYSSGGAIVTPFTSEDQKTVDLYAVWTPKLYTINYFGNSNDAGSTPSSQHTYDVPKALTANGFTRNYYEFVKWKGQNQLYYTNQQTVVNLLSESNTFTMTAQWKPICAVNNDDACLPVSGGLCGHGWMYNYKGLYHDDIFWYNENSTFARLYGCGYCANPDWDYYVYGTKSKVDLTYVNTITFSFMLGYADQVGVGISATSIAASQAPYDDWYKFQDITGDYVYGGVYNPDSAPGGSEYIKTQTMDVSQVTGSYYVKIRAHTGSSSGYATHFYWISCWFT